MQSFEIRLPIRINLQMFECTVLLLAAKEVAYTRGDMAC